MKIRLTFCVSFIGAMTVRLLWAASYAWIDPEVFNSESTYGSDTLQHYTVYGHVDEESEGRMMLALGDFLGYAIDGDVYIKQRDQNTTPMPVGNDYWALTFNGAVLSEETIFAMTAIPLCDWDDHSQSGGIAIDGRDDIYLAFLTDGRRVDDEGNVVDGTWVGWFHVSIDNELNMTLLDSDVNLNGGPIIVGGIGPIPEPTSAMLVLFGFVALALRRRTCGLLSPVRETP